MKKLISIIILPLLFMAAPAAQEAAAKSGPRPVHTIPLAQYNRLALSDQSVSVPGVGAVLMAGEFESSPESKTDNFIAVAQYTPHLLKEQPLQDYPDVYHNIELFFQRKWDRHQYFGLSRSTSDEPVSGGLQTYAFFLGYGYEVVRTPHHSLYLGGSLGVAEWGLELPGGGSWPVLPLPFLHYEFDSRWLDLSLDFTTSPMLDFVLAPDRRMRMSGSLMVTDMALDDIRDLTFDVFLEYRFFGEDSAMGDFAGLKAGVLRENYGYDLGGGEERTLDISWLEAYGTLDLSFLQIKGGYVFSGKEYYQDGETRPLGDGFSLSVQMAWQF